MPVHPVLLNRVFGLGFFLLAAATHNVSGEDVLTQRNNNQRTGVSSSPGLDQNTVKNFQLLKALPVDAPVLAQPLVVQSQDFKGLQLSVLWIATARNSIYAFNADAPFENLCQLSLGEPDVPDPKFVSAAQLVQAQNNGPWIIGIESTPVIDLASKTMFVSYRRKAPVGQPRLASIDITTCTVKQDVAVPGNAGWQRLHRNRASLLLDNHVLFIAFAGIIEYNGGKPAGSGYEKSWQGWIHAFDAGTLRYLGAYRTMHDAANSSGDPLNDKHDGGGIWQASTGLAADSKGNIFFATGNANRNPTTPDLQNLSSSIVRLSVTRAANPDRIVMTPADWFTPYSKIWQDFQDIDLGSAGVVLIPGTKYLAVAGKEGILYVLDQSNMGKFDNRPMTGCPNQGDPLGREINQSHAVPDDPQRDHVAQKFPVGTNQYFAAEQPPRSVRACGNDFGPNFDFTQWPHVHGTPAFGDFGGGKAFLYIWPEKDHLQSFRWLGDKFDSRPVIATNLSGKPAMAPPWKNDKIRGMEYGQGGMPGAMLSLSIDPTKPGAGVLFASIKSCGDGHNWQDCSPAVCGTANTVACFHQDLGVLRAFDPISLKELWNDQVGSNAGADKTYNFAKFVPPTVAQGKAYLATASNKVLVYGSHASSQSEWRFCQKCNALFFDGSPNKGRCPAGGSHQAAGINFLLAHDVALDPSQPQQGDWRFCAKCGSMFFDGYPMKGRCAAGGAHQAVGFDFVLLHDTSAPGQANWRFCRKCDTLFFDGSPAKGKCPAGGAHESAGYNFVLPQMPAGDQADWRFCTKCKALFYDGYPDKGHCPAGGGHSAAGFVFVLPHDGSTGGQADWRFCRKCSGMFFDGYPDKGRCPVGGGHEAVGYVFILPHDTTGPGQASWRFCRKCNAMFFDGYPDKGRCSAGGAHEAAGYVFLLNHR